MRRPLRLLLTLDWSCHHYNLSAMSRWSDWHFIKPETVIVSVKTIARYLLSGPGWPTSRSDWLEWSGGQSQPARPPASPLKLPQLWSERKLRRPWRPGGSRCQSNWTKILQVICLSLFFLEEISCIIFDLIFARLQELLESEKMYVSDLEQVYTYITYMRESKEKEEADIPMPDDLREGRDRMIFGNLENIYEWHRE